MVSIATTVLRCDVTRQRLAKCEDKIMDVLKGVLQLRHGPCRGTLGSQESRRDESREWIWRWGKAIGPKGHRTRSHRVRMPSERKRLGACLPSGTAMLFCHFSPSPKHGPACYNLPSRSCCAHSSAASACLCARVQCVRPQNSLSSPPCSSALPLSFPGPPRRISLPNRFRLSRPTFGSQHSRRAPPFYSPPLYLNLDDPPQLGDRH